MPGVNEKFATGPVAPVFPHAPQVSQLGESSTLFRTVVLGGAPDGVGVGDALGVGEGEAAGLGVGDAAAMGVPLLVEAAFPPHPLIANKTARTVNDRRIQLRTVHPLSSAGNRATDCTKRTKNLDYYKSPKLTLPLGWSEMRHIPPTQRARSTCVRRRREPWGAAGHAPERECPQLAVKQLESPGGIESKTNVT